MFNIKNARALVNASNCSARLSIAALALAQGCPIERIDELYDRVRDNPLPESPQDAAVQMAVAVGRMLDER